MWHPSPEQLARLVDETPTAAESEHLATCAECAAELDAMRAEHDVLGALPRILPVSTSWEVMRHRLEREGLVHGGSNRLAWMPGVAAALALFLAGGATGVAFAGGLGDDARDVVAISDPIPAADQTMPAPVQVALDSIPVHEPEIESAPAPTPTATPKLAARDEAEALPGIYGTPGPSAAAQPNWDVLATRASRASTPDEAARFVRDAEGAYLAAMTRLAELTEAQSSDPAVRLATLDGIVVTTAAALERAPADPVINGYHLAARAQRDALLRTVSSSPAQDPWY